VPASQEQKVDFLLKKIGYSASKTGIAEDESTISSGSNTPKKPFEEGIPSPLIIPQSSLWADSGYIPTTPPGSDTVYVKGYRTATALRMTRDATVGTNTRSYIAYTTYNNTSSARLTNWIDTQFGSSYIIKVYKGDPNSSGVELQQAGANAGTDGWFFDYSSGILNFNGVNLPSGITATNIYIVGYRYIGATGARPPAGIGTFENLYVAGVSTFMGSIDANSNLDVAGISTFQGLIDANGLIEATAGQNKIPSLYANYSDLPNASSYHGLFAHVHQHGRGYFAHGGAWFELVNKESDGRVGTGTETYNVGFLDATNLDVTGITTLGSIGISTGRITGPAITYIDPATVGDDTGTLVVKGNLQVEGTQTTVNSSTMTVTDKNIELAKGAANDAAADGGGITVESGGGNKTWQWLDATDSWTSSEHIRIPDDKVFGFATDTNTYIGRPAGDTIAFTHGGSERVRITSSGDVGINSTAPAAKLDVNGTSQFQDDVTFIGASYNTVWDKSDNRLEFADLSKLSFGGSLEYQMYHKPDTSDLRVEIQAGTNYLLLGDVIDIKNAAGNKNLIAAFGNNGTDNYVKLSHDGNERIRTTNTGVSITGITTTTQLEIGTLGQSLVGITTILDEDNFASNSAAALATQQSIKAYVDSSNPTGSNLAVSADSGSNESINLATEVLDIEGTANEIETATGTNKVVIGLPDNVSIGGTLNVGAGLTVVGVSTFSSVINANNGINLTNGDNKSILLGDSDDMRIRHTGSHSEITDEGTGSLRLGGNNIVIGSATFGVTMATFAQGGAVNLYHNDNSKLTTTGTGINVTGLTDTDTLTTGNATFTGTISAGSTTGTNGYYLKTTGIGVTWAAFPSSRTTSTQTATAGQTSFNFSYSVGFLDVFLNGVKLPSSEFTASNGSTIVLDDAAFANDTLEFISLNTLPVSSGGAQNLTGLADVTITGTPVIGETLQHNGSQFVNDYTVSTTTTSTSQTAILNLPIATYRSVEYTIQMTEGTKYHVTKVLAIHNGTNVYFNEYGTLFTNSSLSAFALDVNSGNIRLLATPASTNSTVFKVKFTGIKV